MSVGKLIRYGLPFTNVAASNTATATITPGRTLETLRLKLGGTFTKAQITLLRLKVNAKTVIEVSGDQLDKINAYRGKVASLNFLDLDLADFSLNNEFDRHVGSWDTGQGIANITAEVVLAAGPVSPTLIPILIESANQKSATGEYAPYAGMMTKILRYPFNISAGGKLSIPFPMGPVSGSIIKRAHFFHNGQMLGITIKQDGIAVHESVMAENQYNAIALGRVPQTNVYTVDFVADGAVNKSLYTRDARSLEWIPEFAAADSGTVVVEYIDPLGNL